MDSATATTETQLTTAVVREMTRNAAHASATRHIEQTRCLERSATLAICWRGNGSAVPGISSPDPSRIDVEEWLAEKDREASKLQVDTLWYAKAAFGGTISVGVAGIIVTIVAALFGK